MAETADAIIKASLRLLGVIEAGENALDPNMAADGLVALNDLLDEWSLQGYMQTNKVQLSQVLTPATGTYTFGTGGDNSTRPVRITKTWVRDSNNNDYPVQMISNDRYSEIIQKTLQTSYPQYVYYREEYPLTVANLYPVPDTAFTLYLETWATIGSIATGSTSVDLPPGYISAIKYNLAVQISAEYKIRETFPLVQQLAARKLAWIKRVNSNDRPKMNTGLEGLFDDYGNYDNYRSLFL